MQPQTIDELIGVIDDPTVRICSLDLSALENGDAGLVLAKLGPEFPSINNLHYDNIEDSASAVQDFSRRHAIRRRLLVGADNHTLAPDVYEALAYKGAPATSVTDYTDRMTHWWNKVREQQDGRDDTTPEFNTRYCVINELRGHDAFAGRTHIIEVINKNELISIEKINAYFEQDTLPPRQFKSDLLNSYTDAALLSPLDRALLRDGQTPILKTDPRTSKTFWEERDLEIDAMLERIDTHDYESLSDKLRDMSNIDQTMRKMWTWTHVNKDMTHFISPIQREKFQEGISDRISRVDIFNTQTLKDMLKGRAWFNDDFDGVGAAHRSWLIAQHADQDPEFQEYVLGLMRRALGNPGVSKSDYAYLVDRVLVKKSQGDPYDASKIIQRYDSQGRCTNDGWKPFTVEDPENIDALRATVGLGTMKEYISVFNCGSASQD